MKNKEAIEMLQSLKRDMTFMIATRITAIDYAIKCVELMPELVEALEEVALKAESLVWTERPQYIAELIDKAKETME